MSDLTSKMELPLRHVVVVHEMRSGEPWPVLACEFREDGHVTLKGPDRCGEALPLLIAAGQKCAAGLVIQEVRKGVAEKAAGQALAGGGTGGDAGKSAHAPLGVVGANEGRRVGTTRPTEDGHALAGAATRPTYEALEEQLAELRKQLEEERAMMNERLEERTQGLMRSLARARVAPSAPSFRAGWEAGIEFLMAESAATVGLEEALRKYMEKEEGEAGKSAHAPLGDVHALAGAATGDGALGTMRPTEETTTEGGEA